MGGVGKGPGYLKYGVKVLFSEYGALRTRCDEVGMILVVRDTNIVSGGNYIRERAMDRNLGQGCSRGGNLNRGWGWDWGRSRGWSDGRRNGDSTDSALTKARGREG